MERLFRPHFHTWLTQKQRKPLILRGARQVGKTWLVRKLAANAKLDLIEVNFERNPEYKRYFAGNDPAQILGELSLLFNKEVSPSKSLLFLDEIQEAGDVLAKLRWFSEEMPELPVVAVGSLLEFTLADHDFSMPVGRVAFRNLDPMGFEEFLMAHGQGGILNALSDWRPGKALPVAAHDGARVWFHRFCMIGGMPEVVAADVAGASPAHCRELQKDLMTAFRADFAKYSGRMQTGILDSVLKSVAGSIGHKFVYARAGEGVKQHQAKRALELLAASRLCHLVKYSPANGLPLEAESKDSFRKAVLLDVGLLHALLATPASGAFPSEGDLSPDLRGRIAEQTAAQHLRLRKTDGTGDGDLHYWQREGGRPGEIDYLVAWKDRIIPVELKSGATGAMKGLHQFMYDKNLKWAVRCDANPPGAMEVKVTTTQGDPVQYQLLNVPLYLLWNLDKILEVWIAEGL